MSDRIFAAVKDLPDVLRAALADVGYAKKDVAIEPRESTSLIDYGMTGRRGFAVLLDLATGRSERHDGSWGGANAYCQNNAVDLDSKSYALPPGGAVLRGSEGYGGVSATIVLHPENVAKLLPVASADVTDKDRSILAAIGGLKAGEYRREALARLGATATDIDSLVSRGYLARNKAGAISITTNGKNARGNARCY